MVRGKQKEPHLQETGVCCSFRPMENTSTGPGGWFSSCSAAGSSSPLVKIIISSAVRGTTMVSSARASSAGAPLCLGVCSGICSGVSSGVCCCGASVSASSSCTSSVYCSLRASTVSWSSSSSSLLESSVLLSSKTVLFRTFCGTVRLAAAPLGRLNVMFVCRSIRFAVRTTFACLALPE